MTDAARSLNHRMVLFIAVSAVLFASAVAALPYMLVAAQSQTGTADEEMDSAIVPGGLVPTDDHVGPVGIVNELRTAHSNITSIMIDHSNNDYTVANDFVFTMTYVDEQNEELVVVLDLVLLSLGLQYDADDIADLLGNDDIQINVSYGIFVPGSHIIPSSQSDIDRWIDLYNDRCTSPTSSRLCQALTFNLETQNHYTLDSNNVWQPPGTATPSTTPATGGDTVVIIEDNFEGNFTKWAVSSGWQLKQSDEYARYPPDWPATNRVAEVDGYCSTVCTMELASDIDLTPYSLATLEFARFVDRSVDGDEFLKVDVYNGTAWSTIYEWSENSGAADDTWYEESYDLSEYLNVTEFSLRFSADPSSSSEDLAVDNVRISGTPKSDIVTSTAHVVTFSDDFEEGTLDKWTESGELDWRAHNFDELALPPNHNDTNNVAEADNCDTQCVITLASPIDLSSLTNSTLKFYRYIDNALDHGEYLRVEVTSDGTNWTQLDEWTPENGDDDDEWHLQDYNITQYQSSTFSLRFIAHMSSSNEEVGIDDVEVSGYRNTSLVVQGGELVYVDAHLGTRVDNVTGTIGIVTRNSANQLVAVSASHVLLPGGIVDRIYMQDPTNTTSMTIGALGTAIQTSGRISADAAYALLNSEASYKENTILYDSHLLNVTAFGGINDLRTGSPLKIGGSFTDSVGGLQYHNVTVRGGFDGLDGRHSYTLINQMSGSYNAINGDSGAPIFNDQDGVSLLGLHVGITCQVQLSDGRIIGYSNTASGCPDGSLVYGIFSPWETIQSRLGLR